LKPRSVYSEPALVKRVLAVMAELSSARNGS